MHQDLAAPPTTLPQRAPASGLPAWVRAADALAGTLLVFAVIVAGDPRPWRWRLPMPTPLELAAPAVALIVVRQAARRRPSFLTRMLSVWPRLRSADARAAWVPFAATRIPVLLVAYLSVVTIGYEHGAPPWRAYQNEFLNLPARWDAGWYLGIATDGYEWNPEEYARRQQNIVFFPAYPLLMRGGGVLLGGHPLIAGWAISLAAFYWALVYLHKLARQELGGDAAAGTLAATAVYPFAIFFSTAYTESLFLLCSVAAFYHVRAREHATGSAWALAAGFTRPNGFFMSVPLAWLALAGRDPGRAERGTREVLVAVAPAAATVVGMVVFSAFIGRVTHHPFVWMEAQAAWNRSFAGVTGVTTQYERLVQHWQAPGPLFTFDMFNLAALILAVAAVVPVLRRLGVAYALFIVLNIGPSVLTGGLLSIGRFTSVLFPVFMWLGACVRGSRRTWWNMGLAIGQGLAAALFFTWRGLY